MPGLRFENTTSGNKGFSYGDIFIAFFVFLFLALTYIWSHVRIQQIEYKLAAAKGKTEQLVEEQKRLQLEYSQLAAPKRVEELAIKELQMRYPQTGQIVFIDVTKNKNATVAKQVAANQNDTNKNH